MSADMMSIDQVVADRFRIEGVIGQGGMGTIYRARHVKLPRAFALKVLKPSLAADPSFVKRFLREAVAASQVVHPNVVNVTDYGQLPDGNYYIAMEHLDGVTLDDELERLGRLPVRRALDIIIQLADALDYCHAQDIVHRDLKTENVLLCTVHGRPDVVKLVDFGIARILGPDLTQWQVTQGGMIFGTPEYLSPERALDEDIDGRSDLYALGVIAYELVVGDPPFTGRYTQLLKAHINQEPPPPSARAGEPLPAAYDALVLKCLAKNPEHRFQSCGELGQELRRLRGTLAGAAGSPGLDPPAAHGRQVTTDGGWSSLESQAPSQPGTTMDTEPASQQDLRRLGDAIRLARNSEEVRRQLENALKELAYALSGDAPAEAGWLESLNEILRREQTLHGLREELDLLARQREDLRRQTEDYARALRQLLREATAEPQVRQRLQHHLDHLQQGSDERRRAIVAEQERCRAARREQEAALADHYAALRARIRAHGQPPDGRAARLAERIARLEQELEQARKSIP
jgi:serine/threonine protein kinase